MNRLQAEGLADMILGQWLDTPKSNRGEIAKALEPMPYQKSSTLLEAMDGYPRSWRITSKEIGIKMSEISDPADAPGFATVTWPCQICKHTFQFNYAPPNDAPYAGVFAYCPRCGFPPMVRLSIDGGKVYYRGEPKRVELFIKYHKDRHDEYLGRTKFFNSANDRKTEFEALQTKGLLPNKTYASGAPT